MQLLQNQDEIARAITAGAVGVLPTDTVYGLAASALDQAAVARLYGLKQREQKPGTVIAADVDQLIQLGLTPRYLKAVTQYWPGPISVVVPCGPDLAYLHQGLHGLAVRVPALDTLRDLLAQTGPLITTSANHPGKPTATTLQAAQDYFGDQVDFYVDGGDLSQRAPSTIIRIIDDAIEVVREGAMRINERGEIEP